MLFESVCDAAVLSNGETDGGQVDLADETRRVLSPTYLRVSTSVIRTRDTNRA